MDLAKKAIAVFRDGFDVSRVLRIIGERLPEFPDGSIQAGFEINEGIVRPELFLEFLAADNFAGAGSQRSQQQHRLLLEANFPSVFAEFARSKVGQKGAELEPVRGGRLGHRGTDGPLTRNPSTATWRGIVAPANCQVHSVQTKSVFGASLGLSMHCQSRQRSVFLQPENMDSDALNQAKRRKPRAVACAFSFGFSHQEVAHEKKSRRVRCFSRVRQSSPVGYCG